MAVYYFLAMGHNLHLRLNVERFTPEVCTAIYVLAILNVSFFHFRVFKRYY